MTLGELCNYGRNLLSSKGLEYNIAALETDVIIGEYTGYDRLYIMLNSDEKIEESILLKIKHAFSERVKNKPMAYILGHREFGEYDFYCQDGVLIPRPDTEILVDTVEKILLKRDLKSERRLNAIEIGVGTGIISISLLSKFANLSMIAGDINPKAIELARKNAMYVDEQNQARGIKSSINKRFSIVYSDIFQNISALKLYDEANEENLYDFIVSNPPYIKSDEIEGLMEDVKDFEPISALDGFEDGLYFYKKIIEQGYNLIKHNGFLAFEIGYDQAEAVKNIFENNEYRNIEIIKDLAGLDRVVVGFK